MPQRGPVLRPADIRFVVLFLALSSWGLFLPWCALAESRPILTVADSRVVEGNSGTTNLVFTLHLSKPATQMVMVDYATRDITAVAGEDYLPSYGVAFFSPGSTDQQVLVSVNGDTLNEADETFWLMLTNAVNATLARDHAVGVILNDDPPPTISISPLAVVGQETNAAALVKLSSPSGQTITVDYFTGEGTAVAGRDFVPVADTLTFVPGMISQVVHVPVCVDRPNPTEAVFSLNLGKPMNAGLETSQITEVLPGSHVRLSAMLPQVLESKPETIQVAPEVAVQPVAIDASTTKSREPITSLELSPLAKASPVNVAAGANKMPVISPIADQMTSKNTPTAAVPFTVSDVETPPGRLLVLGTSANRNLLPEENIIFTGTGSNRAVILVPARDRIGTTVVTLTAVDENGGEATANFTLAVSSPGTVPLALDKIERHPRTFNLKITAEAGYAYSVESRDSLAGGSWHSITNFEVPSVVTNTVVFDSMNNAAQRFYRVKNLTLPQGFPAVSGPIANGGLFQFAVATEVGRSYAVEYSDSLASGDWRPLTNLDFPPITTEMEVTDLFAPTAAARFYRATRMPIHQAAGPEVSQAVPIQSVELLPARVDLFLTADAGRAYTIEYCDSLAAGWHTLTNVAPAPDLSKVIVSDLNVSQPQRYYRLRSP